MGKCPSSRLYQLPCYSWVSCLFPLPSHCSHWYFVKMSNNHTSQDDSPPESGSVVGQKCGRPSALQLGPRKKPSVSYSTFFFAHRWWLAFSATQDPLVHHGRHFGRTVHAFCNVQTLLTNGLMYMVNGDGTATAVWVFTSLECETALTEFVQRKEKVCCVLQPFVTYS